MGSGSSKGGAKPQEKKRQPPSIQTVANVNKREGMTVNGNELSSKQDSNDDRGVLSVKENDAPKVSVSENKKEQSVIPYDSSVDKPKKNEKEPSSKNNKHANKNKKPVPNLIQFEEDSDIDDDIDAVLKIPMPVDNSRQSRDKNKKSKKDKENINSNDNRNFNNNYPAHERNMSSERTEDVPETYAQRLQRQQYKLQQNMLLREKTIVRNPGEWQFEESDDDEEEESRGFDASKFRQVNQGGGVKKDVFSTSIQEDFQTPRYMQTTGQEIDDVDVQKRGYDHSPHRELPRYNQSELDLMRQLEEDIL